MTPAHVHISFDTFVRAGKFPIKKVGDPGTQGAGVTGIQGIGVNTPRAADVAAATWGFARDEHTPKGRMFTIGLLSMIVATGVFAIIGCWGMTTRELGAAPKLHCSVSPMHTAFGIASNPRFRYLTTGQIYRILPRDRYFSRAATNREEGYGSIFQSKNDPERGLGG